MTVNSFRQIPLWRQQTRKTRLYPQIAFLHESLFFTEKNFYICPIINESNEDVMYEAIS